VRDIILGMSDGLTVPFALAAGLSAAVNSSFIVLVAGIAELAREQRHIERAPEAERAEVREILAGYGLGDEALESAVAAITANPRNWIDFMLRNELELERPEPARARNSALTIGLSYVAGGVLPLVPYAMRLPVPVALAWSAGLTFLELLSFGAAKGRVTGVHMLLAPVETAAVGSLAAGSAYYLARLVNRFG
jgi:VIT1/CCC1 family predicted Fe2+/Mn2+ transporter